MVQCTCPTKALRGQHRLSSPWTARTSVTYIQYPGPTLAFIGTTWGTQGLSYSEYWALALAKVWSNTAKLPSSETMRELYEKSVEERGGYGKDVLFLIGERLPTNLRYNRLVERCGGQIGWQAEVDRYWQIARSGGQFEEAILKEDDAVLASVGLVPVSGAGNGRDKYVLTSDGEDDK